MLFCRSQGGLAILVAMAVSQDWEQEAMSNLESWLEKQSMENAALGLVELREVSLSRGAVRAPELAH